MKRFLFFVAMLFISLGIFAQYVDLGLPSGTLWYVKNEGGNYARYTYDEAVSKFGNKLPTEEQLEELKNQCTWIWGRNDVYNYNYEVVGPNGNSIYLPVAGYRLCDGTVYGKDSNGEYWSSTPSRSGTAYFLDFNSDFVYVYRGNRCVGRSVRLVVSSSAKYVESSSAKYVDLGLPSGTLWCAKNEGGDYARYTYDEAVSKFGNKLPTEEQLEELKNQCTWTWTGSGYKVVGPNGNSIYLPAEGYRSCTGGVGGEGSYGTYCSSTPYGSDYAYCLCFYSDKVNMYYGERCDGRSVRLVQD